MASTSLKRQNKRSKAAVRRATEKRMARVGEALEVMRRERLRPVVLRAMARQGTLSACARASRMTVAEIRAWCEEDPTMADAMVEAHEQLMDTLEERAHQIAMAGSERLIEFLLKAGRREKYGDQLKVDAKVVHEQVWKIGDAEVRF